MICAWRRWDSLSYTERMDLVRTAWLLLYIICPPLLLLSVWCQRHWRDAAA